MQTPDQLREHYEIERELADRLRAAPSSSARRRLYGEVYRERSERIAHHPLVQAAADPQARAEDVAPQVRLLRPFASSDTTFLEIGAGDGAVAKGLAPYVKQAIAIDVTDALALPSAENFEFRVFDGFDLGAPDQTIDLAYSNDVVEHLHPDDMLDQARAIRAALRPGGRYVCVTPNRLSGPHDISGHFVTDAPRGFHLREYTATELSGQLRDAGFASVDVLLSYRGHRLSPTLPAGLVRPVETAIARLPHSARRRIGPALAAVKVVATP